MPAKSLGFLKSTTFGRACRPLELERVARAAAPESWRSGDDIDLHAEASFRVLTDGVVALLADSPSGRPVLVDLLPPGRVLCPQLHRPAEESGACCRALSLTDTSFLVIPKALMAEIVRENPAVVESLRGEQSGGMWRRVAWATQSADPVGDRLRRVIGRLDAALGPELRVTRRALGLCVGTTTETVIRLLRPMLARGWLAARRGRLLVLRPRELAPPGRPD